MITSTIKPSQTTQGVWIRHQDGDVHIHTEDSKLVIGSNKTSGQNYPNIAVIMDGAGIYAQLLGPNHKLDMIDLPPEVVAGWLQALLAHAEGYARHKLQPENVPALNFQTDTTQSDPTSTP